MKYAILLDGRVAFSFNTLEEAYNQKQILNDISLLEYSEPIPITNLHNYTFEDMYLGKFPKNYTIGGSIKK